MSNLKNSKPKTTDEDLPIRAVKDIQRPKTYVFYGRSGSGKTTLSGSFPKPLLLLDVKDGGTDSISDVKDVHVMDINTWADLQKAYDWLLKNPRAYKTLVIDTITQLQAICVEKVLTDKKKDASRAGDWGVMSKREWGDVAQLMKVWVVQLRDLPMEVVFLAQERVFNVDEDTSDADDLLVPEVGPRLSPSVAGTLCAAVNVIGNTYIRLKTIKKEGKKEEHKMEHCLRIGPDPVYLTKMRKPKDNRVPDFIVNPDYQDLIDIINGEY